MANASCGLKNSQCRDVDESVDDVDTWIRRFSFVDQRRGLWSSSIAYPDSISCPVGGIVVFYYPQGLHDVVELPSRNAYSRCNMADAVLLSPRNVGSGTSFPDVSYYHFCTEPDTTTYLTCSVPGHCLAGQKIQIFTNGSEYAYDPLLAPADDNYWNLHVTSLNRLLRLLNWRVKDDLTIMDHGFQTEELATVTAELVWCAIDHCPLMDSEVGFSVDDCESILYTLLGFINRKRPISLWDLAEEYYRKALERGGSNECTAQSYLSLLYWTRGNFSAAVNETGHLCALCLEKEPSAVLQTRVEWETLNITVDDFDNMFEWDSICSAIANGKPTTTVGSVQPSVQAITTKIPSQNVDFVAADSLIPTKSPTMPRDQQSVALLNSDASWIFVTIVCWFILR